MIRHAVVILCAAFLIAAGGDRIRPFPPEKTAVHGAREWSPDQVTDSQANALIAAASVEFGVPANVIEAVIIAESEFSNNGIRWERRTLAQTASKLGAASIGLMQVMGWHAGDALCPWLKKPKELWDPAKNIRCGTAILADAIRRRGLENGLIEYNGGESCVVKRCRWGANYAKRVMALIRRLDARGADAPELK